MPRDEQTRLTSVERSFDLIEALVELDGATVTELTRELQMPKTTIHDHLKTLEHLGYVLQQPSSAYYPSTRFLSIGGAQRNEQPIYRAAKPKLNDLASETGEHATLMIEENGYGVVLFTARGDLAVQVNTTAGIRTALHTTALGKAILVQLPEDRLTEKLETEELAPKTRNTITDPDRLREDLDRIREEGVAFDDEERLSGLRSVASPILTDEAETYASIGIFGPASRVNDSRMEELIPKLREAANVIEIDIKYSEERL